MAAKYPNGELIRVIRMPTAKMSDGGMQPIDLSDPDAVALAAYVAGLK
jgi:hypothetical protein